MLELYMKCLLILLEAKGTHLIVNSFVVLFYYIQYALNLHLLSATQLLAGTFLGNFLNCFKSIRLVTCTLGCLWVQYVVTAIISRSVGKICRVNDYKCQSSVPLKYAIATAADAIADGSKVSALDCAVSSTCVCLCVRALIDSKIIAKDFTLTFQTGNV